MVPSDEAPFLEMQARLASDDSGEERRRLLATLGGLRAQIHQSMAAGVAPAEFRVLEAADAAAEAAEGVVTIVWRRNHGTETY